MITVLAHSRTSAGPMFSQILMTDNEKQALDIARSAEELGYHFHPGDKIVITQQAVGHVYKAGETTSLNEWTLGTILTLFKEPEGKWLEVWSEPTSKREVANRARLKKRMLGLPEEGEDEKRVAA